MPPDEEGEFYVDRHTSKIYYWPLASAETGGVVAADGVAEARCFPGADGYILGYFLRVFSFFLHALYQISPHQLLLWKESCKPP